MMNRLELSIAWRYLRSRRGSSLLSFISIIAIGGVIVGVSALIEVMGVKTGLQRDLRGEDPDREPRRAGPDVR
jgi:lipoprotein-releasing system permease protein